MKTNILSYKIHWLIVGVVMCVSIIMFTIAYQKAHALSYLSPVASLEISDKLDPLLKPEPDTFVLKSEQNALPTLTLSDSAYIAVDDTTGQVIVSKNASSELPIASLTKIMSAMVALDLMSPTETITVSKNASLMPPTKIGISEGEEMTVDELLHAMLMTSANDAAQAVADGVNEKYTSTIFVWAMNEKAQMLGLHHTHFANPQGFDSTANYSSAEDLVKLAHYALTYYPEISHIVAEDYRELPQTPTHKQYDLYNWNGLLDVYPSITGVKIGNTDAAAYTNIVVSERNGEKIMAVVLGAQGELQRDLDASALLDSAFASEYNLPAVNVTAYMLEAKYNTWKYWN